MAHTSPCCRTALAHKIRGRTKREQSQSSSCAGAARPSPCCASDEPRKKALRGDNAGFKETLPQRDIDFLRNIPYL